MARLLVTGMTILDRDTKGPIKVCVHTTKNDITFEKYYDKITGKMDACPVDSPYEIFDIPHYLYVAAYITAYHAIFYTEQVGGILVPPHERNKKPRYYLSNAQRATCPHCGYTDPAIKQILDEGGQVYSAKCPNCDQDYDVPGTGLPLYWRKNKK
jgi:hypothetical protein